MTTGGRSHPIDELHRPHFRVIFGFHNNRDTEKVMSPPTPSSNDASNGRPSRLQRQRLRPLKSPSPVQVRTDEEGLPAELHRRGKRFRVVAVRERWRIDDEWWRTPISREYFALVLEDGRPIILFRDLVAGGWYGQ